MRAIYLRDQSDESGIYTFNQFAILMELGDKAHKLG
jgi:hypothetical protein